MSQGSQIGSSKNRFQKHDLLLAKIMPSLANKKIALATHSKRLLELQIIVPPEELQKQPSVNGKFF